MSSDMTSVKKFTSLDNTVVAENLFILNPVDLFSTEPFSYKKKAISVDIYRMKFLPDNLNMIKGFAYVVDTRKSKASKSTKFFENMNSASIEPQFEHNFTFQAMQPSSHYFLLIVYGTFEDIMNTDNQDEDVDFDSLVFGFSIIPLFKQHGTSKVSFGPIPGPKIRKKINTNLEIFHP